MSPRDKKPKRWRSYGGREREGRKSTRARRGREGRREKEKDRREEEKEGEEEGKRGMNAHGSFLEARDAREGCSEEVPCGVPPRLRLHQAVIAGRQRRHARGDHRGKQRPH